MTPTIYLDSSALLKRVLAETGSDVLRSALRTAWGDGAQFVTCTLARVEVARALRTRLDVSSPRDTALASARALSGVATADITKPILESARVLGPHVLRTLDAIHLATAIATQADQLWSYDRRVATVAEELGIPSFGPA